MLVTGPTGCSKSTAIASMIEEINKARKAHIVTIEDPVEFVFKDKKSLIEQREVGTDTKSFANALKYVFAPGPQCNFGGEMRDPETIATVLTAAETGHLVFPLCIRRPRPKPWKESWMFLTAPSKNKF